MFNLCEKKCIAPRATLDYVDLTTESGDNAEITFPSQDLIPKVVVDNKMHKTTLS